MVVDVVANFVQILAEVLVIAIIIRALASWIMPNTGTGIMRVLFDITEPILAPIRRILPTPGGLDLSPIIGMIAVQVIASLLVGFLHHTA